MYTSWWLEVSLVPRPSHPSVSRLVLQATNAGVRRPGNEARARSDMMYHQHFESVLSLEILPIHTPKMDMILLIIIAMCLFFWSGAAQKASSEVSVLINEECCSCLPHS